MSRVPLVSQADLPEDYRYLMDEDALGERNIFRALGNVPPILRSYMLYGTTLWKECGLSAHRRELVILAIGRALRSEYEWEQHVDIGHAEGVTPEEMRAIGRDDLEYFDEEPRAILEYARAFATSAVTDDVHEAVAQHLEPEEIVGIGMLASHYVATAVFLDGFDVPLELDEFVGWEPDEPAVRALTGVDD